jgi:hypothetical protein
VLYTLTGDGAHFENTLLTACERSGYRDIVTDFYRIAATPAIGNGAVRFQLREQENEVTFLHDVRLMTVDHSKAAQIAVATDGSIFAFERKIVPIAAIDGNGIDRLSELVASDGAEFTADEAGELIVTFARPKSTVKGFSTGTILKNACPPLNPKLTDSDPQLRTLTIELLDGDGNWVKLGETPSRQLLRDEIVLLEDSDLNRSQTITLRLSWNDRYQTDAVTLYEASDEIPVIQNWAPATVTLSTAEGKRASFPSITDAGPVVLRKDDMLELSFATNVFTFESGSVRDYVIVAVGRYEPDYSVHTNLLPATPTLVGNYPNPFNPSTTIYYTLPTPGHVRLDIINIVGQIVATIVDRNEAAGSNQVVWNADNRPSGVYFYRMTVNGVVDTKKMLLLK